MKQKEFMVVEKFDTDCQPYYEVRMKIGVVWVCVKQFKEEDPFEAKESAEELLYTLQREGADDNSIYKIGCFAFTFASILLVACAIIWMINYAR